MPRDERPARPRTPPVAEPHRFPAVTGETLSRKITLQLVASIIEGHYAPGDLLPTEEALCQQLGVSRSVVREATKAVTMLGMVRTRQGRGTEVLREENWNEFAPEVIEARRQLHTVDEFLVHLLELRRIIEVEAASLAAQRATPEDVDEMRTLVAEMEEAGDDPRAFARVDVAFHDRILAATGNRPLRSLLRSIEPALLTARMVSLTASPSGVKRSIGEHRLVLDAIASGSAEQARAAMSTHLSWTANLSLDRLSAPAATDA